MILQIPPDQFSTLLPLFPDLSENVHVRYFLTNKLCEVYLIDDISNPKAVIVRPKSMPSELFGYRDPVLLFEIIHSLKDWQSLLVENDISKTLGQLLSKTYSITYEKELYFVLNHQVETIQLNNARLLTPDDLSILQADHYQLNQAGVNDSYKDMLTNGIVTGIIVDNQLASMAHATHITEKYADIGIFTSPIYRNKGLSISTAELLISELQAKNLIPVWSTDEHNLASLKVAQKLGFIQTHTKTFINLNDPLG